MRLIYGIIGIIISYLLVRYRNTIIEFTGEMPEISKWFGSMQLTISVFAVFVFFLSILYMTNNLDSIIPTGLVQLFGR